VLLFTSISEKDELVGMSNETISAEQIGGCEVNPPKEM